MNKIGEVNKFKFSEEEDATKSGLHALKLI